MFDKKKRDYFFLDEKGSIIIYTCFISIFLLNIIPCLFELALSIIPAEVQKTFIEPFSYLEKIASFMGVSAPLMVNFLKWLKSKEDNENYVDNLPLVKIKRKQKISQIYKAIQNNRFVILTGESGSGKTSLAKKIKRKYYKDNNYFNNWANEAKQDKNRIVILDQFERAIHTSGVVNNIETLRNSNKIILFCIRKENCIDVLRLLSFDKQIKLIYLNCDKSDIKKIEEKLHGLSKSSSYGLYDDFVLSLKASITKDETPIMAVSMIIKLFQIHGINTILQIWKENHKSFSALIHFYIMKKIDALSYKEIGYPILYLLCCDKKYEFRNGLDDFKDITFGTEAQIRLTLKQLLKMELIKHAENPNSKELEYEIAHDYLIEKILSICTKNMPTDIRGNIEDYNLNQQHKRNEDKASADLINYKNYYDSSQRRNTNVLLGILCFIIFSINVFSWFYLQFGKDIIQITIYNYNIRLFPENHAFLASLSIVMGLSIYYIYNYYYHFLIMFGKRFISVNLIGMLVLVFACIFNHWWAIFLGIEIIYLSMVMKSISTQSNGEARIFFKKRFQTFLGVGIVTIVLGIFFERFTGNAFSLAWPFFCLYGANMFISDFMHINKNYILTLQERCIKLHNTK